MNEITKIHLGRQAFIVSVDAHKALQDYLRAIKKHAGDSNEVLEEVELRMAELLTERGVQGKKVVLLKDVDYLKSQLGKPGDFGDEEDEAEREEPAATKRLFRDPEHGMIAGVAAGLAAYFGIKPVIVRVLFILVLLSGFGGLIKVSLMGGFWLAVLAYCALWVAIPKANSGSDRLQMQGKPVTVDAIKDVVERADVKGAAGRVQRIADSILRGVLRIVLGVVGLGLVLAGIAGLFGVITMGVYWSLNHDLVPAHIFPVGTSEVILIGLTLLAVTSAALFCLTAGVAIMKRKWPLPGWGIGAIAAVLLVSLAASGGLAADAAPRIKERYEASRHTYVRTLPEFSNLNVQGGPELNIRYEEADTYSVSVKYWGDADFSDLKTDVKDQTLTLDARPLVEAMHCSGMCLFHSPLIEMVVRGHKLQAVTSALGGAQLNLPELHNQTLKVRALNSSVAVRNFAADSLRAELDKDGVWTLTFAGDYVDPTNVQELSLYDRTAQITARNIDLVFERTCGSSAELSSGPWIGLGRFDTLTINGEKIGAPKDLWDAYNKPGRSAAKCANMQNYVTDNL